MIFFSNFLTTVQYMQTIVRWYFMLTFWLFLSCPGEISVLNEKRKVANLPLGPVFYIIWSQIFNRLGSISSSLFISEKNKWWQQIILRSAWRVFSLLKNVETQTWNEWSSWKGLNFTKLFQVVLDHPLQSCQSFLSREWMKDIFAKASKKLENEVNMSTSFPDPESRLPFRLKTRGIFLIKHICMM